MAHRFVLASHLAPRRARCRQPQLVLALALCAAIGTGTQAAPARAQQGAPPAEPTPMIDPRAAPVVDAPSPIDTPEDPASTTAEAPALPSDDDLSRMMDEDVAAARPLVRRAARSSERGETRALVLRLLGARDPSSATSRICARALRIDPEPLVRRAGAECLGRVGVDAAEPQTPSLVAALDDDNLDVVTMSGWALSNVGAPHAYARVVALAAHPDARVARLFVGYAERMRARLGLDFTAREADAPSLDADGNRLVPGGAALTTSLRTLDVVASVGWLFTYGASVGWLHGAFTLSAQGGPDGASIAPLTGLAGGALGATALATYGFVRADTFLAAHTIVHFGMAGTLAGFGGGILTGEAPANAVAASNLSLVGTLGGTALGVALVELDAVPTAGALALGAFTGLATGVGVGGLARGYLPSTGYSFALAGLTGGLAGGATTLAAHKLEVGLFPIAGGTLGLVAGAGVAGGVAAVLEQNVTETSGWIVLSGAALGAAGGSVLGLLLPRGLDPFLSPDVAPDVRLKPPTWALLDDGRGGAAHALVLAGAF